MNEKKRVERVEEERVKKQEKKGKKEGG